MPGEGTREDDRLIGQLTAEVAHVRESVADLRHTVQALIDSNQETKTEIGEGLAVLGQRVSDFERHTNEKLAALQGQVLEKDGGSPIPTAAASGGAVGGVLYGLLEWFRHGGGGPS